MEDSNWSDFINTSNCHNVELVMLNDRAGQLEDILMSTTSSDIMDLTVSFDIVEVQKVSEELTVLTNVSERRLVPNDINTTNEALSTLIRLVSTRSHNVQGRNALLPMCSSLYKHTKCLNRLQGIKNNIDFCKYVTRFYRTDPNRTSGKIKLTPPVDSYTIVLQVLTLSTTQTTRDWFLHTSFLSGVECSNGGFRPCEGPGLARISGLLVDSLIMLARRVLC